jgi:hypothetical protein
MQSNSSRRRFLAVGSAATVFASLHGAIAQADDPVFAALADLERVRANVETVGKVYAAAEEAIYEARAPGFVEFEGEQIRSLAHLDATFKSDGTITRKAILSIIRDMRANLPPRLSPAHMAARDAARAEGYRKARAELEHMVAAATEARAQSGFDQVEAAWDEATGRVSEAEDAVLGCNPRIAAGALALLRFVAENENMSSYAIGPEAQAAILRAVAVIERDARK